MIQMMNIVINGTEKVETLSIIDSNGIDFTDDLIGNYGALSDGQFTYDADADVYRCDQDTFDWWATVLAAEQELDDRIADLAEEHGSDAVYNAIGTAGDCDLEDQAAAINAALDEAFGAPVK